MFSVLHALPDGFENWSAKQLADVFSGPTLFHLEGIRKPALFVSMLLHGNEDVGWLAVRNVLSRYRHQRLPRDLLLLFGNPEATRASLRKLPWQPDHNRVWPGTDLPPCEVGSKMGEIVDYARSVGLFVNLDFHNNTGTNPIYGCVTQLDPETLQLATLFSRTVVYFERPLGVQSAAMAPLAASLTCECGRIGDPAGVERAEALIEACLHLHHLPDHLPEASDLRLLQTRAIVKVDPSASVGFEGFEGKQDVNLMPTVDHWNFRTLETGTTFATKTVDATSGLRVVDTRDQDVTDQFFALKEDRFELRQSVIPAMLTLNLQVIRDDCLGYFMEQRPISDTHAH